MTAPDIAGALAALCDEQREAITALRQSLEMERKRNAELSARLNELATEHEQALALLTQEAKA